MTGDDYEPGDVNTVAGDEDDQDDAVEYEAGDVNTTGGGEAGAGGEDTGNRAAGGAATGVLEYIARSLASDPDAVVIQTEERQGSVRLRIHVAPDDMGRLIGRRGRTAQAIRTLVAVAGARDGVQTSVDIVDD